jgi:hypothetical protein
MKVKTLLVGLVSLSATFASGAPMLVGVAPGGQPVNPQNVRSARLEHYRSLAQQAMDAVKQNDLAAAIKFSQTLAHDWDQGELAVRQSAPEVWLWGMADQAMDDLIGPIIASRGVARPATALNTAYQHYLARLKLVH